MEENKTIFDYIGQALLLFGNTVLIFMVFGLIIGDFAMGSSTLFELGSRGFTIDTLLQLLLLSVVVTIIRLLFLSDKWIKNMRMPIRILCFLVSAILLAVVMAVVFGWFPVDEVYAWLGFGISFVLCTVISVLLSRLKEKAENKKMEQALEKLQKMED